MNSTLVRGHESRSVRVVYQIAASLWRPLALAMQRRPGTVHTWYPDYFGKPCSPCVLEGLYAGTLTPNPLTPYPELHDRKVQSYRRRWDWLSVARASQHEHVA